MTTSMRHSSHRELHEIHELREPREGTRAETRAETRAAPPHPHILIVDDDQDIRETLRFALEDEGYEVYEAEDGAEALTMLRKSAQPFVVVLDLRMPRLTGDALLRRVSKKEHLPAKHTFLLVTANHELLSPVSMRLLERMDVPVVAKPFDLNDLLGLVARAADTLGGAAM
ncbi:MAG TPA: response regulator [Ktedonobacterales bacterium]|nr:response regulator [Ktedonobacterales bacterium]